MANVARQSEVNGQVNGRGSTSIGNQCCTSIGNQRLRLLANVQSTRRLGLQTGDSYYLLLIARTHLITESNYSIQLITY
jgi:hypothetical protein